MLRLFYFLLLMLVISLVCSAVRRDHFRETLHVATRLFLYLSGGTIIFCAIFYLFMEGTS